MNHKQRIYLKRSLLAAAFGLLLLPLLLYTRFHLLRPPRTNQEVTLFQGITYQREARSTPRAYMLHIVTIDLTAPGIGMMVTPGKPTPDGRETHAQTTEEFLREFKVQLAVNGSFFYPFREHSPLDFYPRSGERTNVVGQAISQGIIYSKADDKAKSKWPVLCFDANNRAQIVKNGECSNNTVHAVAGNAIFVDRGTSVKLNSDSSNDVRPYPRMAVAIDRQGQKLWLIAVDGKQPLYSEGITLGELSEIVVKLGGYRALNLDGGGSTTLVVGDRSGVRVLNSPIHTKLPMRQRPVANNLGFFARNKDES